MLLTQTDSGRLGDSDVDLKLVNFFGDVSLVPNADPQAASSDFRRANHVEVGKLMKLSRSRKVDHAYATETG